MNTNTNFEYPKTLITMKIRQTCKFFHGSEYLPKIGFSNVYIFKNEHLKHLFEKIILFEDLISVTFSELAVIAVFCRYAMTEKRILQHIFFSSYFNP